MHYLFKIVLPFIFSFSLCFATEDGPDNLDVRGVSSNDVLWMHPTASYKSKKIGKVPYNAKCLKNLGCKGQWCKINYKDTVGWVNGKFLGESRNCSEDFYSENIVEKDERSILGFSKYMLQGVVLQTQLYGSDLTVKFVLTKINSYDGEMIFHFSTNDEEQDEILAYQIKNGKIIFYGYDGSKHRMTLLSVKNNIWTILEEEDMDGDDKQFGFGKPEKQIYKVIQSGSTASQKKYTKPISSTKQYDELYMQIYGRLDTRMASNRAYLKDINKFIIIAAPYIMDKYKFELKLHNLRFDKSSSIATESRNEKTKFQKHLINIERLDGKTIVDYDDKKYRTFEELEKAFKIAGKKAMELQRMNYHEEDKRKRLITTMKKLLDRSGTQKQKNEISKLELTGQKYDYKYYKNLLDDNNILLMPDRQGTQGKPIFHNQLFIIALLMKKQGIKYLNSDKLFDLNSIKERVQNIKSKSRKLKHQFNQDYLYELRTKPSMYPN